MVTGTQSIRQICCEICYNVNITCNQTQQLTDKYNHWQYYIPNSNRLSYVCVWWAHAKQHENSIALIHWLHLVRDFFLKGFLKVLWNWKIYEQLSARKMFDWMGIEWIRSVNTRCLWWIEIIIINYYKYIACFDCEMSNSFGKFRALMRVRQCGWRFLLPSKNLFDLIQFIDS